MSPIFIEIFGFQIRYYSLMYIIAFYLGLYIGQKSAKKYGYNPDMVKSLATWVMVTGLIGARAYYIFLRWDYFKYNLMEIVAIWRGIRGLAIHGGIAGAALGLFIFSKIKKVNYWDILDLSTPSVLLGQAIGRIGNLMNGETHGVPVFTPLAVLFNGRFDEWWQSYQANPLKFNYPNLVPWGMVFPPGTPAGEEFPNILVHPTMVYEIVLNFIGFLILYFYFRNKNLGRGSISAIYVIMYGIIRAIVSFFRAEDLYFMGIKAPNIASIILILVGCSVLYLSNRKRR
ncbi:MAG TPA: prolipoprotein diacylglyceryl transferase [Fusobacteria bacterium]|nr:prolipoprotein diacylglyceryl transferase [Fusobacteriota bacterium]